jgi:hydrophobic/amphiphilic exporter-1 (mainly G- bacteria), HAE1 family
MSITVSLVAVFIPVLLMGGIIGRIFNEFAVVVTVAILASAFVSLTLIPMLAAKILSRPERDEAQARWSMLFERGFDATLRGYDRSLKYSLRHQPMMLVVFLATLLGTVWLVFATPKGFFPQEDIGQLSVSTEARQDISFAAMVDLQRLVADAYRRSPHVANVASIIGTTGGSSGLNNGRLFVELKPRDQRPPLHKVLADLRRDTARIPGISAHATPVLTCVSADARAEPNTSSSCRASIGRSSTSGRIRWRTR